MTSFRNIPEHPGGDAQGSTAKDAYLDAARECILDVGWRRTTLTEVARRAKVSRMTIYRAWSDMPSLLADLMTREWTAIMGGVSTSGVSPGVSPGAERHPRPPDPAAAIAEGVVAACRVLRDNELFVRIVELDPELLLPYLLSRRGRSQEAVVGILADLIERGQAAGRLVAGDPTTMARAVVLASHGHCLSVHTMADDQVTVAALDEQLQAMITAALRP